LVYGPLVAAQFNGARLAAGGNPLLHSDLKCSGVEAPNSDAPTPLVVSVCASSSH